MAKKSGPPTTQYHKGFKVVVTLLLTSLALVIVGFYGIPPAFGSNTNQTLNQQTLNQVPPLTPCARDSYIAGTIFLDGKAAPGFQVKLDPGYPAQTTGADGRYKFGGLVCYFYVVKVVNYNTRLVRPINGRDYSEQTVTGATVENAIDFYFESVPQPTATPTPTATPVPPTVTPTLVPSVTPVPRLTPQCPGIPGGSNLQVSMAAVEAEPNFSYVCIRITQSANTPDLTTDLNRTIILDTPALVSDISASSGAGTVASTAQNVVWRPGVLQPGQSVTLIVGVSAPIGSLSSMLTNISGAFSTGQTFSRTIVGILQGVLEIAPNPVALPYSGQATVKEPEPFRLVITLLMLTAILTISGYTLWRILRKKETTGK
jgi:hypothetical protein